MHSACPDTASLLQACDDVLGRARRTVDVLAPDLDPLLLDRAPTLDALARLTRGSRFTRIRVLFYDSSRAIRAGHRLIHLARRFPSYIQLRRAAPDHREENCAWLAVDGSHLLWRPDHTLAAEGHVFTEEAGQARKVLRGFDHWWQYSESEPALRELHL